MIKHGMLLFLICLLSACAGAALESARMSNDARLRSQYMEAALAGDAQAQYEVGQSYCCAPRSDVDAFYNNRKATEFLCRAARQNHPAAAFELGKFHSGDRIDGVRWLHRTTNLIRGDKLNDTVIAYYWFNRAAYNGHVEAQQMMEALVRQDISRFSDPLSTPCTIDEVYGEP